LGAPQAIGYALKPNDPQVERLFFTKGPEGKRSHYLHMGEQGSGYVEDMSLLRDYLRQHPDAAKRYNDRKLQLAEAYREHRAVHTAKKERLIRELIEIGGKWRSA
jgi:GrpB-like predicted nucleotidyltransferase (UPF0157 family)